MDSEVSPPNLQRGTTNTATVQLDVEETQLTRDLGHKRQVMGAGFHPDHFLSHPRRSATILHFYVSCWFSLHPLPITSRSICSIYNVSPYMPVCPGTAVRGLLPTVFPSAAFSARSCQIQIFQKCRRFTRTRGEAAEGVGRVSRVPRDTL